MKKSFKWSHNTPDKVWWKIIGNPIKNIEESDRRRIQKLIFKRLPTNHMLHKIDEEIKDLCPDCGACPEYNVHFLRCKTEKGAKYGTECLQNCKRS